MPSTRDHFRFKDTYILGFPGGSDGKASVCNAGDLGSIPGSVDPPEKEMATHSSILAWRILWIEEPGRLQSMGSQRFGHDWATTLYFLQTESEGLGEAIPFKWKLNETRLIAGYLKR